MNRSERTYNQLVELLRQAQPATSFTPEEIQSLIEGGEEPAGSSRRPGAIPSLRRTGILVAIVSATIAGWWLFTTVNDRPDGIATSPSVRQAARSTQQQESAGSGAPEGASLKRNGSADPASASASVGAGVGNAPSAIGAPRRTDGAHPARIVGSSAPTPRTPKQSSRPPQALREYAAASRRSSTRHAEQTAFPMLELTPEELKALGVAFVDGGIQTFGEEHYTLASQADRTLFAQMGIDTTQQTGIVRMRLVIDTFGLTTMKYSWTRVDSYSRIAPIIALHSYVKDEHTNAVMVNSFNRSPIVDSANRSIGYMVRALAKLLSSDNVERVMHDSDHANPAPMLVPVHIRLGDEPIDGSSRRRGADVILWYYPTPEFAAALPARYRISLQKELNTLADVVECNLPPGEACRQMTGEPLLLNYCRRTSGALSGLSVSPNPARGTVTMRYNLEAERTITTTLYGIRGERIRTLLPGTATAAGARSVKLELDGVAPGAYMVVLRSEQGEQVSERLIVQ